MLKRALALGILLAANAAQAQSSSEPYDASSDRSGTVTVDPGRPSERDGLASRGGPDPIRGGHSFSQRIGTPIYSPMGTTVNSQRIAPR